MPNPMIDRVSSGWYLLLNLVMTEFRVADVDSVRHL
jgi:hypothetical protein